MGRVNIYIRKEDENKWTAILDKPKWLHKMINGSYVAVPDIMDASERGLKLGETVMIETNGRPLHEVVGSVVQKAQENGICKIHKTPLDSRSKCLQKGCKYA
jgi:hypothetical protein